MRGAWQANIRSLCGIGGRDGGWRWSFSKFRLFTLKYSVSPNSLNSFMLRSAPRLSGLFIQAAPDVKSVCEQGRRKGSHSEGVVLPDSLSGAGEVVVEEPVL